ncbi:hypothetical protein H4R18_005855 [Coemansia javaensis]|uniref:Fungal-type protein kinase domain-containing protein n=1 Tax=Coemansia javaensis TaxID=2761396 RepID=A0A9W8LEY4_9FUNG|nr:hypothetical protein H4R18_005855 [Coemansia javaensis]
MADNGAFPQPRAMPNASKATPKKRKTGASTRSSRVSWDTAAGTHSAGRTPLRPGVGSGNSAAMRAASSEQTRSFHETEAVADVEAYLRVDVDGVLELAAPEDPAKCAAASRVAEAASEALEALLAGRCHDSQDLPRANLASIHQLAAGGCRPERQMYPGLVHLVRYVARRVKGSDGAKPRRLILPTNLVDFKCHDDADGQRIDIGLECRPLDSDVPDLPLESMPRMPRLSHCQADADRTGYINLFAVLEAKASANDATAAYTQLFKYTRMVYESQYDRRFAWGVTVCGTGVRVCVLGPNFAAASPCISLATEDGRAALVRLLVRWSFCEEHQLGYDPSIAYEPDSACWSIQVPGLGGAAAETFYTNEMFAIADRLFGRHTRCFYASPTVPRPGQLTSACDGAVVIKDMWPEAPEDEAADVRDEIKHLTTISAELRGVDAVAGMYPTIVAGGRVQLPRHDGDPRHDTTPAVFGAVLQRAAAAKGLGDRDMPPTIPPRIHKRVAMTPVGRPLRELASPYELVVAVAHAMRCHSEIVARCGILHRDISPNNIMFVRETDGGIRGLLIDFDHAISLTCAPAEARQDRTGTLPFMSIGNLKQSDVERTALDDWESVIYILCWFGVIGLNSGLVLHSEIGKHPQLKKWVYGTHEDIATEKRTHLNSNPNFTLITGEFNKAMNPMIKVGHKTLGFLSVVTEGLRSALIDNDGCRGALRPQGSDNVSSSSSNVVDTSALSLLELDTLDPAANQQDQQDPFALRVAKWREISQELMRRLDNYRRFAEEALKKAVL